jgi:PEP-CTERM motif
MRVEKGGLNSSVEFFRHSQYLNQVGLAMNKRMNGGLWLAVTSAGILALLIGRGAHADNVLENPGFETDAVLNNPPIGGASGWGTFVNASTASAPGAPVHTGVGSLQLTGGGGFSVPGAFQTFPANPGDIWDMQGYMLTQSALPTNATFGLLKIVFTDGASDLVPGPISIGQAGPAANPGIESLPQLNSTSALNTWQFTQARGVAPAGTTQVKVYALFVDQSAGTGFFDDLQASLIPANPSVLGDYNSNNIVDAADYTVWRDHLGQAFTLPNRDTNNSGNVNQQDYTFWKGRFGAISGAGALSGGAVPEPATGLLALLGLCGLAWIARRK